MKKLLMAALLAVVLTGSAFAKETSIVNSAVATTFGYEFKKASAVTWSTTTNYVKATFTLDNERMEAYYNYDGDKIGTSKAFNVEELPLGAKRALAKKYEGFTIKQAIEFAGIDETAYFIFAENEKESVILKVNGTGGLSTYKRTKK